MNRQIHQCRFNVALDNGSSVSAVSGFPVNVAVTSGAYTYKPYYYTGTPYDEAITGRLRSQLGGYRFEAVLSWERLINSAPLINVLNQAYTTTNAEVIITFFPDASNTSLSEQVVISDSVWASNLDGTIVRQPISVSLIGRNVTNAIPQAFRV